ncbi:MAG TPA: 4-(cytidine 5'-diphospho)-2-C-methyl-D-erythritol kinase [Novosphingobium sp.]|nr:4-(cytidine 5'-diphospho)-2-C-methyl-D-erythritol kinase [Novosphingobium sp.]
MHETAYAKINLALHVRGRRADGYHEIETLFAFVDEGDRLTASPATRDVLHVKGEFADQLTDPFGNIVARALTAFRHVPGWSVQLEKRLPVAAGLGGGSADAAAVIRMVRRWGKLPDDWRERAAKLGADVPACVESVTCIGTGTGTDIAPFENDLTGTPVLLVNPRLALSTAEVFRAWGGKDQGPLPAGDARTIALNGRNDLEIPAIALCPVIAEVLETLRGYAPILARMSGSGASCFALFEDHDKLLDAMERLRFSRPGWWMCGGLLR